MRLAPVAAWRQPARRTQQMRLIARAHLNELAAWLAGFGILFNATYYRQFHFAHHRYAQEPARDPELLTAPPPRSSASPRSRSRWVPPRCSGCRSCGSIS